MPTPAPMFTYQETSHTCKACQIDAWTDTHPWQTVTAKDRNAWAMWACTCTQSNQEAAMEYMTLVTQ